nr:hypothetical protein [uncultured Actinoplanes sp.]
MSIPLKASPPLPLNQAALFLPVPPSATPLPPQGGELLLPPVLLSFPLG